MKLLLKINILLILTSYSYSIIATEDLMGSFGLSSMQFNYQEFKPNGVLFNEEHGILPGIKIGITQKLSQGFISASLSYYLNEVNYKGETQAGLPFTTRTDEKLIDLLVQWGQRLKTSRYLTYQGYVGLGFHQWQRDIRSTSTVLGLLENYQWWYGLLGLQSIWPINDKSRLQMDLRFTYPIHPTIKIDFQGIFDEQQFNLNGQWGQYFSLAWQYQYSDTMKIIFEPYLEYWHFAQSATQPLTRHGQIVGSLFEPGSETHNYGLTIYLQRSF